MFGRWKIDRRNIDTKDLNQRGACRFVFVVLLVVSCKSLACMMATPRAPSLPLDVMGEVMKRADQASRVACMTVSKAWHAAAVLTSVWDAVRFEEVDATALEFVLRHPGIRRAVVHSHRPDDVAWFFDALADAGHDQQLRDVQIDIGPVQRVPSALLRALARHTALESLSIDIAHIDKVSELSFPKNHAMTKLQKLSIREYSGVTRQLVLWFNGTQPQFQALRDVHLCVGMSDVMVGVDGMVSLKELTYLCDEEEGGETYEDINMHGADLDRLELEVGVHTDFERMCTQLQHASVRTIVLHFNDDFLALTLPLSPDLRHLMIGFRVDAADVELDFPTLRDHHPKLEKLTVCVTADWIANDADILESCDHTLVFRHIPDFPAWLAYVTKVHLEIVPTTRICMTPG